MFRDSSDNIEEFTTSVTGFFNKSTDDVIPTVTLRMHRNQNQWIAGRIHAGLKAWATTFKEQDMDAYKKARNDLQRAIKHGGKYRTKIESYYTGSNACRICQGHL
jgi:excinuclease UvrABC nuclease subunit